MSLPIKANLIIRQGKTFDLPVRWETEPIIYKPITAITQSAPMVVTCPGHSIPDGWKATVVSVKGMTSANAQNDPPRDSDYHVVAVRDSDTIEFNTINSSNYKPYLSGGYLQFYTPHGLGGYMARMSIKDKIGGTVLLSLTTENGRLSIDPVAMTIKLFISAVDTALQTWRTGTYDLELVAPDGTVSELLYGSVIVLYEVTTDV